MVDRRATIELVVRARGGQEVRRIRRDAKDLAGTQELINKEMRLGNVVEARRARSTRELARESQRLIERYDRGAREARRFAREQELLNRKVEQGIITQQDANRVLRQREQLLARQAAQRRSQQTAGVLQGATTLGGSIGRGAAVGRGFLGIGLPLGAAGVAIGGAGLAFGAANVVRTAADYQVLEARIRDATRATGDFQKIQQDLFNTAQAAYTPLEASVTLFQRLATARNDLGVTNDEILNIVDNVQKLGIISGANQQQLRAGLIQLAQSFASNVVRAEEMNSILENIPSVARLIAEQMGTSSGQLRLAVTQGKILSSDFAEILKSTEATAKVMERFADQPRTIARQSTQVANQWARTAAALNGALGLSRAWSAILDGVLVTLRTIESVSNSINETRVLDEEGDYSAGTLLGTGGDTRGVEFNEPIRIARPRRPPRGAIDLPPRSQFRNIMELTAARSNIERGIAARQARMAEEQAALQEEQARQAERFARDQARRAEEARAQQEEKMRLLQEEVELRRTIAETERQAVELRLGLTDEQQEQTRQVIEQQREMRDGIVALSFGISDAATEALIMGENIKTAASEAARAIFTQLVQALVRTAILMGVTGLTGGFGGSFLQVFGGQIGIPGLGGPPPAGFTGRSTRPGRTYRVNEAGPETFVQGGNTYLLAGGAPGRIEPAAPAMQRPIQVINNTPARVSTRETATGTQITIDEAVAASEANLTRQVTTGSGGFAKALKSAYGRRQLR